MARTKVMTLRGASVRKYSLIVKNNAASARVGIQCDITSVVAEKMGWEIFHAETEDVAAGFGGVVPLEGEVSLEEVSLQMNGTSGDPFTWKATSAEDFKLVRKRTGEDDEAPTYESFLRFTLVSGDWEKIAHYFVVNGTADGMMKLYLATSKREAQPTLDEQPHLQEQPAADEAKAEEEEPKGKSRAGSLSSKRAVMEKIQ